MTTKFHVYKFSPTNEVGLVLFVATLASHSYHFSVTGNVVTVRNPVNKITRKLLPRLANRHGAEVLDVDGGGLSQGEWDIADLISEGLDGTLQRFGINWPRYETAQLIRNILLKDRVRA